MSTALWGVTIAMVWMFGFAWHRRSHRAAPPPRAGQAP